MVKKPRISVVIPTLNREAMLNSAVAELLNAPSEHMEELIVVDQSDLANEMMATLADPRLIYRRVDFKNLPKARNFGTAFAQGDVILFLDDDVCNLMSIVDAHARAHLRTGADLVTGPMLTSDAKLISVTSLCADQVKDLPRGKRLIANLDAEYVPLFAPGVNASYRKSLLDRLGGFDENFLGSAVGEDAEMSHRVRLAGGRIIYDPKAALVHLSAPAGGCRDEIDLIRRAEAGIFNAHYFWHKIGGKSQTARYMAARYMLGVMRASVLNAEALRSNSLRTTAIRVAKLMRACRKARRRTAELLRDPLGRQ